MTEDLNVNSTLSHYRIVSKIGAGGMGLVLGQIYNAAEKYSETTALTEGSLQTDPTSQFMLQISGYAYAMSGRRHEAEEIIKR